jgi:hypothetical protein
MALTNAQRQARWRDSRNEDAQALKGKPKNIADKILRSLGAKEAARVVRALDKRLRNIKPDCRACNGTGFVSDGIQSTCGIQFQARVVAPCDCGEFAAEWGPDAQLKTNDDFQEDTFEPSEDVEEPAQVLTNLLDSVKDQESLAEACRKIFNDLSFDGEAKAEIYKEIKQLIAKWRRVQSTLKR